ncbi:MAG: NAD(P)-dependent oxidoreductase [Clostridia bacterium]|nr:NAD(P)-dependent oxidoreductase [Clostridia bacterium]
MKRAFVVGASGHAGSYLVPKLIEMGYEVHAVARGNRAPYTAEDPAWGKVIWHYMERRTAEGAAAVSALAAELAPQVLCDLISYTKEEMQHTLNPILEKPDLAKNMHVIQLGTVWVYGVKLFVPVTEDHPRNTDDGYGANKAIIERYLHSLAAEGKIKSTVIFPGHISGRGWVPINPQGNVNMQVYRDIREGKPIMIPDDGNHTLHHVHSADIADLIAVAIENPDKANGETFHATTERAVTLSGMAEMLYRHFGHVPKMEYVRMEKLKQVLSEYDYINTSRHLLFSSQCSMEKAKRMLGFVPKYNTLETILDCLNWQEENGNL